MPAPDYTSINNHIALAKGWTIDKDWLTEFTPFTCPNIYWFNPEGKRVLRPDYVGTLKGMAQLMQELQSRRKPMSQWAWYWNGRKQRFVMRHAWFRRRLFRRQIHAIFHSREDQSGRCVGSAWLSVFGKETTDASSEH